MSVSLATNYGGLILRSPVILGSAGIAKDYKCIKKADAYGAGAAVMKTLFEEELMAQSPTPRFAIIERGQREYCSTTNLSYEQGFAFGIDAYCEEISKCKRTLSLKIIASIGCSTIDKWRTWAQRVEAAGADAIEMNLSCPHSDYVLNETRASTINAMIERAVPVVREAVSIPVFTKLTPQLENPVLSAKIMEQSGSDGICAFNRFLGMDIDIENKRPILHGGYGGHGGPWSIHYSLRWISEIYKQIHISISGSGGVICAEDAIKYILAGATTVQLCFIVFVSGYSIIQKINDGITAYLQRHHYDSLDEIRGLVTGKAILDLYTVDRRKTKVATIDSHRCAGCGRCAEICVYDAIAFDGNKASIQSACDGCGLCCPLCAAGAISMTSIND